MAVLQHLAAALLAGLAFYALSSGFRRLRGYRGLGLGDVKLAAAAGAWTGPEGVTLVVLVATFGALAFVLWLQLTDRGNVGGRTLIPFGAFLAPAIWLVWSALRIGAT